MPRQTASHYKKHNISEQVLENNLMLGSNGRSDWTIWDADAGLSEGMTSQCQKMSCGHPWGCVAA